MKDETTTSTTRPVAEVRVTLHSLEDGEAEVAIAIDPEGELSGVYGDEEQRFTALQVLFEAVQRELADALDTLANGEAGPDEDDERDSLPVK
jgi:hypothetical protein